MATLDLSLVILRDTRANQPSASIPGRLYFVTDENVLERDTGSAWENVGDFYSKASVNELVSNASTTQSGSLILSGGQIVWESDLIFRASAASYLIQSTLYESSEQTVTLDAADATNPRIDVIALNTSGTLVKVTGEPGATPSKPDIDPTTQIELTFVLVPALATTPSGVSNTDLYLECAGSPAEWSASGTASVNVNSTSNPRTGTKDIELTNAGSSDWFMLSATTPISITDQELLVFYIRSKASWANAKSMRVAFRLDGVVEGNYVTLDEGLFGFSSAITDAYQQIAIPISSFSVPGTSTVNEVRFEIRGGGGGIGAYFDDIVLQGGSVQIVQQGISKAEADTRYLRVGNNLSDLADDDTARQNLGVAYSTFAVAFDGGGSALQAGTQIHVPDFPYAGQIERVTLGAIPTGTVTIDIWKDTYSGSPPTDADSITGGNEPAITSHVKYQDSTLTDWTKTISAGDWFVFNIDSATTVEQVTVSLRVKKV